MNFTAAPFPLRLNGQTDQIVYIDWLSCAKEIVRVTLGVLNRFLQRRQAGSGSGASGDGLVAVELAGKKLSAERAASCGLAVVLARGRRIAVSAGFDAATLQRLVQVLETM